LLVFDKKEYAAVVSSRIGGTSSVLAKWAGKRPTARTIGDPVFFSAMFLIITIPRQSPGQQFF
jgi:hypothetical protein